MSIGAYSRSNLGTLGSFNTFGLVLADVEQLRGHEETRPDYLKELKSQIKSDGILKRAIAVDRNTYVILDGHHRLQALKELGYTKIPVILIDYQAPNIKVFTWRDGENITKKTVISTALADKKLPPKTSKHTILVAGEQKHISAIETVVNIPLEKLK